MVRVLYFALTTFFLSTQIAFADSLRVTPEWLKSNLQLKNLIIVDSRPKNEYDVDHIVGAINFPDSLTYQQKSKGGQVVESDVMQKLMRERGIDYDKLVVIYDAGQLMDATRVFWTMEVYGLSNVKILTSGYDNWMKNDYPINSDTPNPKSSNYVVSVNHRRIASKFSTQLATKNPRQVVVDARGPDSYQGKQSTATRFGHIPTAVNFPITLNIKDNNGIKSLRTIDELKKVYSDLPQDSKVITYCEIGRASSTVYYALRELGYEVANYDSSWREWGNDLSLPIEK